MNKNNIFVIFLGCLCVGCAFSKGSGSVDSYINKQIEGFSRYSKRPIAILKKNDLTGVQWEYEEDKNGFIITICGDHFKSVDNYFRQMLGNPSEVVTNNFGNPKVMYYRPDFGFSVEYSVRRNDNHSEFVSIIILKPKDLCH